MKRLSLFTLIWVLTLFLPTISLAIQSKGIKVVIKDRSGREVGLYKGSYALLIGVSHYTAGWPNLESVPGEIDRIEAALKKQGFHVEKVLNPTSDQLSTAFETFIDRYGFDRNNRLLFFFSGHGHTRKEGKKGYLVPTDTPDPRYDDKGFVRKALGMGQVLTWARRIEAKHALFVFDSCFSGTIFRAKALPKHPPHISDIISRPVRQFISAGSAGEEVPAQSVFVPSFIRALRGKADLDGDGYVTGTELGMYLHKKVLSYETGQTPQYGKIRDPELDEGDFVFALKAPLGSPTDVFAAPPLPPESVGIEDYDKIIKERKATKKKWFQWQVKMEEDFAIAERYDRSTELTSKEKAEAWASFLSSYKSKNAYSTKDEELRERAQERQAYWMRQKDMVYVPKLKPRVPKPPSIGNQIGTVKSINAEWGFIVISLDYSSSVRVGDVVAAYGTRGKRNKMTIKRIKGTQASAVPYGRLSVFSPGQEVYRQ